MAIPLVDTLSDLLSASSGALVGAIVTGLFNRGRHRKLSDMVMAGEKELEKQQMENGRLLDIIKEKENTILEMQMGAARATTKKKATKKRGK